MLQAVINMKKNWENAIITDIKLAIYVDSSSDTVVHNNRSAHGFVINDSTAVREYVFSDGTVLKPTQNSVFYLPKGSSYRARLISSGGCWVINFDLAEEIRDVPFMITPSTPARFLENFKEATVAFRQRSSCCDLIVRKNLYEIITKIVKHTEKNYLPSKKAKLIQPAIDLMNHDFAENDLSVSQLAELCSISEAYFRRIFSEIFSVSPKEYIINRRIEYAKLLLTDNQFTVSQVAELCGYAEPCHFSRQFSMHTGVSPKTYTNAK